MVSKIHTDLSERVLSCPLHLTHSSAHTHTMHLWAHRPGAVWWCPGNSCSTIPNILHSFRFSTTMEIDHVW